MCFQKWQETSAKSRLAGRNFANENYLSLKTLEMLTDIKFQLLELLVSIGFVPINLHSYRHRTGQDRVMTLTGPEVRIKLLIIIPLTREHLLLQLNKNGENIRLLTSVLCTALYPNIVKVLTPQTIFLRSAAGAVPVEREAKELRFKTQREEVNTLI